MNEIEQNVWRTIRAVTVLAVLVVLLLSASSIANTFDLSLSSRDTGAPLLSAPTGPGVRVQSYAEIIPGAQNTAHAWALGPDQQGSMTSNTIANKQELSAAAQSMWPRATMVMEGRSGWGSKEEAPVTTASPVVIIPTVTAAAPFFLVQQPIANLRSGPGTEYPILGLTHAGNRYPIIARTGDWWQLTVNNTPIWIHSALGVTEGNAGAVANIPAPLAVPPAAPELVEGLAAVAVKPTTTPTRLPSYAYSVETERHAEANTLVAYALIQDSQAIVGDLHLLITHAGQQWRSGPSSYAVSGVTKPADPGSPENKTYNAKIDFPRFLHPDLDLTGEWTITLVDANNTPLSVTTVVQIVANDPQQEIYLHYRKVKL